MDLKQVIRDNCNPVGINNLIRVIDIFEDLEYEDYLTDVYDKVEEALENDSVNVGRILYNIIIKHSLVILEYIGIRLSDEHGDILINEIYEILNFNLYLEYSDAQRAQFTLDTLEAIDDVVESYSTIISEYTSMTMPRVYAIIEHVDIRYINNMTTMMNKIVNEDMEDEITYALVNIIKGIRLSNASEIVGLRIVRNNFNPDQTLTDYLKVTGDMLDNKTMEETAVDFMSLIILGSDSRFNRIKSFTEYCEDLIEDEDFKARVYNRIKMLDEEVEVLFNKYNLKKDKVDGED